MCVSVALAALSLPTVHRRGHVHWQLPAIVLSLPVAAVTGSDRQADRTGHRQRAPVSACRERTGPATKFGASARRVATCVLRGLQAKSAKQRAGHERRAAGHQWPSSGGSGRIHSELSEACKEQESGRFRVRRPKTGSMRRTPCSSRATLSTCTGAGASRT